LLISDWVTQLTARRCAAHTDYMRDRVRRGLDSWDQPDELYPDKLSDWMRRTPDGLTLAADLQLYVSYQRARDGTAEGGQLQLQIYEKALPALKERVARAAIS
jgi:hypothetical protein